MNGLNGIQATPYTPKPKEAAALKRFPSFESERTDKIESQGEQHGAEPVLSQNEQNFFEQLYPNSAQEIRSYQTYRRDGERVTAAMGSVVDRKG
jgi:hypothetical protein